MIDTLRLFSVFAVPVGFARFTEVGVLWRAPSSLRRQFIGPGCVFSCCYPRNNVFYVSVFADKYDSEQNKRYQVYLFNNLSNNIPGSPILK